jgi:hypothetical protein
MPARDLPLCVGAAYEQLIKGEKKLLLVYPRPHWDDPNTYSASRVCGPIGALNKNMLRFLAGRDQQRGTAYGIWNDVKALTGEGDAYEYEAAELLSDVLWPPDFKGYTRAQLRRFDDRLAQAAIDLSNALRLHPDFHKESSAINWPEDDAERIAKVLYGLIPQTWPNPLDSKKNGALIYHALPMKRLWQNTPSRKKDLFLLIAAISPTMDEMLGVLAGRAKELSSKRFKTKKRWQATGEANDTLFIRHLLARMMFRNPDASADQVAKIISPIVDKALGGEGERGRRTFDRCKKGAQTIRANIEASPELQTEAMLTNPRSPYRAGE